MFSELFSYVAALIQNHFGGTTQWMVCAPNKIGGHGWIVLFAYGLSHIWTCWIVCEYLFTQYSSFTYLTKCCVPHRVLAYCIIWCCRYRLETSSHNTPGASESDTSCKQCSDDALFCQRGTSARHSMATKWTRSFSARSSIYHSRLWDAADLRYRVFRRSWLVLHKWSVVFVIVNLLSITSRERGNLLLNTTCFP